MFKLPLIFSALPFLKSEISLDIQISTVLLGYELEKSHSQEKTEENHILTFPLTHILRNERRL